MQDIAELTVLTRVTAALPNSLRISTEDFQEGWSFVTSGDVHRVDKAVRDCGWHFIWVAEPSQRGGVGQTEQVAVVSALKLALRRVNPGFNAANIDNIVITKYPWFFIAKIKIYPCQIQQGSVLKTSNRAIPLPVAVPVDAIAARETLAAAAVHSRAHRALKTE
jgi:hypothetical protein